MTTRCGRYFSNFGRLRISSSTTACANSDIQNASRLRERARSSCAWINSVGKSCISRYADSQCPASYKSGSWAGRTGGGGSCKDGIWVKAMDWLLRCASPAASFAYSLIFPAHRENSDCTGTYDGSTPERCASSLAQRATRNEQCEQRAIYCPDWQSLRLDCMAAQAT